MPIPSTPTEVGGTRAEVKDTGASTPAKSGEQAGPEAGEEAGAAFAEALELAIGDTDSGAGETIPVAPEESPAERQAIAADGNAIPVAGAVPVTVATPPADAVEATPAPAEGASAVAMAAAGGVAAQGARARARIAQAAQTPADHDTAEGRDPRTAPGSRGRDAPRAPLPVASDTANGAAHGIADGEARTVRTAPAATAKGPAEAATSAPSGSGSTQAGTPGATVAGDASGFATALAGATHGPAHAARPDAGPVPRLDIPVAAGDPGWADSVGDRVRWLVHDRHGVAELQLNPPDLGRIEVRVTFADGEAKVLFTAHHPAGREHLQAALPHLRDYFEGSGIALADAGVHDGRAGLAAGGGEAGDGREGGVFAHDAMPESETATVTARARHGMVDDFA